MPPNTACSGLAGILCDLQAFFSLRVYTPEQAGLGWPLPEDLSEEALYQRLFGEKPVSSQSGALRRAPDWEEVHRELSKRGVSLQLLWQEYREQNPEGYGRTQFHEHYQRWNQAHTYCMRLPHKGGEEMEVDYAGMTLPITNPETGEIWQAQVLPACGRAWILLGSSINSKPASRQTQQLGGQMQRLVMWRVLQIHDFMPQSVH